jgi:hypothetical protein
VGQWVIGGMAYIATESTELDYDHGPLEVGTCVEIEVLVTNPTVATEIESEKEYKCRAHSQENKIKAVTFGVIEELPADLINGVWVIGGFPFVVSPTTELIAKDDVLAEGAEVAVNSYMENEQYHAIQIRTQAGKLYLPLTAHYE